MYAHANRLHKTVIRRVQLITSYSACLFLAGIDTTYNRIVNPFGNKWLVQCFTIIITNYNLFLFSGLNNQVEFLYR